jgi:hypothetical protein
MLAVKMRPLMQTSNGLMATSMAAAKPAFTPPTRLVAIPAIGMTAQHTRMVAQRATYSAYPKSENKKDSKRGYPTAHPGWD